jgi:hypothetical protein
MVTASTKDLLYAEIERRGTSVPVLASRDETGGHGKKSFMAFPDHDSLLQSIVSKPPSERNPVRNHLRRQAFLYVFGHLQQRRDQS